MSKLAKRLIQAAKEARAIARGKAHASTYRVHVPADIDVKAIRTKLRVIPFRPARQAPRAPPRFALPCGGRAAPVPARSGCDMIISDARRFVFVHVPKSAGTSIRAALAPFADGSAASPDTTHETLAALLAQRPQLATHFKFAFVRNPWERLVSFYFYARQRLAPTFPQFQAMDGLEAMLRLIDRNVAWLCAMHAVRPQCDYICGEDGVQLTDFVGRHEQLDADFACACRRIGISAALPRMNVSRHDRYPGYYNGWCRDFVAARYRRDIGEFGYAFDRPDAAMGGRSYRGSDMAGPRWTRSRSTPTR